MSRNKITTSYCNISFSVRDIGMCTDDILWEINDKAEEIFQIMQSQRKTIEYFDGFKFSMDGDDFHIFQYDIDRFTFDNLVNKIFEDDYMKLKSIRFNIPEKSPIYTKAKSYIFEKSIYRSSYPTYEIEWILGLDKIYKNALKLLRKTQANQLECVIVFYDSNDKSEFITNNPELVY